jgi:TonB family protein
MKRRAVLNPAQYLSLLLFALLFPYLVLAQSAGTDQEFDKGIKLYEAAKYAEAANTFKRVSDRDRNNVEAFYYLGNSYFRMYRNQDAVKAYKRVIELKPDHFLAYNNLGTSYHGLGNFKQAINSYEAALRIKPDYAEAIFGLGVAYLELKDKDAALEQHKRLTAVDMDRAERLYDYINDKISLPILNGKALSLAKPAYPVQARMARVSGVVMVWISIDETGKVVSASAVKGHILLRQTSVEAAKLARFSPTLLNGQPVKVTGIITYTFQGP